MVLKLNEFECKAMLGIVLVVILVALIAYKFYKLSSDNAQYFEERNLKYLGVAGTLRNLFKIALRKIDMLEFSRKVYDEFPNEP